MTWLAGTISTLPGSVPATAVILAGSPTSRRWSSGCAAAWSRAPGTTSEGPWSPPIASTARRTPRVEVVGAGSPEEIASLIRAT
jgi:hypothetical protein